jgi:hypothetical protein
MTLKKTVLLWSSVWILGVTALHAWLNLNVLQGREKEGRTFKVGFLPVT